MLCSVNIACIYYGSMDKLFSGAALLTSRDSMQQFHALEDSSGFQLLRTALRKRFRMKFLLIRTRLKGVGFHVVVFRFPIARHWVPVPSSRSGSFGEFPPAWDVDPKITSGTEPSVS